MIYDKNGNELSVVYDKYGNVLEQAYDKDGNPLMELGTCDIAYDSAHSKKHLYAGGYIEVQPDSWDGSTVVTGDIVEPTDPTAWGFPMSLSSTSKSSIEDEILGGDGYGVSFIRFPMGFAYRGYRNIDSETGLAKNIGQRFEGQNSALNSWFSNIIQAGGGLSVEYWCLAPYWITGGAYYNPDVNNEVWAGGSYPRTTTLSSIKTSDPTQYANQIDALTDSIVNDMEYVHQNVAPVRMYTLAAEPDAGGQLKYGHTHWTSDVYNDVFEVLHPKVLASQILGTYDGKPNVVLMHLCANMFGFNIGMPTITKHSDWIWGYSHDMIREVSGQVNPAGAEFIKSQHFPTGGNIEWENMFICEYEYFVDNTTDTFKCANNIVRMIFELTYRKAKVIMPIIHICKPTGQTSEQTNTKGYCLYAVDRTDGSYTVNPWAYNSWKMFNDNLPIGSELYMGDGRSICYSGYALFKKDGKSYIFFGNIASVYSHFSFTFDRSYTFVGKQYDLNNVGLAIPTKSGKTITFDIPSNVGYVYTCDSDVTVTSVNISNDLSWENGYIDDNGELADEYRSYVSKEYTPASGSVTITADGVGVIRLAEYDSNHHFLQREYVNQSSASFTLNSSTAYLRVGFRIGTAGEDSVTDIFNSYTIE